MAETIEGYDIRIEIRDDTYVNYSITYEDHDGVAQTISDERVTLIYATVHIESIIRDHRAGAF